MLFSHFLLAKNQRVWLKFYCCIPWKQETMKHVMILLNKFFNCSFIASIGCFSVTRSGLIWRNFNLCSSSEGTSYMALTEWSSYCLGTGNISWIKKVICLFVSIIHVYFPSISVSDTITSVSTWWISITSLKSKDGAPTKKAQLATQGGWEDPGFGIYIESLLLCPGEDTNPS